MIIKAATGALVAGMTAFGLTALPASAHTAAPAAAAPARAAAATHTQTLGSCSSNGDHAACTLSSTVDRPKIKTMHAYISASPNQIVKGALSQSCTYKNAGTGGGERIDAKTPLRFNLPVMNNATSCTISLRKVSLSGRGKLHAWLTVTFKG